MPPRDPDPEVVSPASPPDDDEVRIRPITVDEFYRMHEAGIFDPEERLELLDGRLIVMPPEGPPHGSISSRLNEVLVQRFAGRATVRAGNALRLGPLSELLPDFALVRRRDDWYADAIPAPADVLLVIEVSQTSLRYYRGPKLRAYAATGVPELWVIDLVHRRVEVYADLDAGTYSSARVLGPDDAIAPRAFSEHAIPVATFLPRAVE
ncbi:MAG TPA: Uma2 family endonuclease [Candidatus Elarobacter sp.]